MPGPGSKEGRWLPHPAAAAQQESPHSKDAA